MATRLISTFFHMLALLLSSDTTATLTDNRKVSFHEGKRLQESTKQKDITTPITTIPTSNPSTPSTTNPTYSNMNPANPLPLATDTPGSSSGGSWCVASPSAPDSALQLGLNYACSHGADCAAIQLGAACYSAPTPSAITRRLLSTVTTSRIRSLLAAILAALLLPPALIPVWTHANIQQ